jgi:hypothetical protein
MSLASASSKTAEPSTLLQLQPFFGAAMQEPSSHT